MAPRKVARATAELAERDPVIAKLVAEAGPCRLGERRNPEGPFAALVRMVCYQQLAGKAAAAIHGRVEALFDGPPTPEGVMALEVDTLRGAGLSASKTATIRALAEHALDGRLQLDRLPELPDDEVVRELVAVRGIGRWTAEMLLMFELGRLDVWPVTDYGVRKGYAAAWGLPELPTPKQLDELGEPFRPWRSVAAWYCWRAADTIVPEA